MKNLLHGDSWKTDTQPTGWHDAKVLGVQRINSTTAFIKARFDVGIVRGFWIDYTHFGVDLKRLKKGDRLSLRLRRATVNGRLLSVVREVETV